MTSHHFNIETIGTGAMGCSIAQIANPAGLAVRRHDTNPIPRGLHTVPGAPRYRPSPWLARRAQLGLSLAQPEAPESADINASNEAPQ